MLILTLLAVPATLLVLLGMDWVERWTTSAPSAAGPARAGARPAPAGVLDSGADAPR